MKDTIFNRNMKVLKNKYFNLCSRLINLSEEKLDIEILDTRDNNKYMRISNDIRTININSRYKPADEAKKWADNIEISRNSKFVVLGFGLGYRITELSNKMRSENSLLIIEPNIDIFKKAISSIDYTKVLKKDNVILLIGENLDVVKQNVLRFTNWTNVKNINLLYIPNYEKLFDDQLMFYVKMVKDMININIGNYYTIRRFSNLFYSNFIENIPHILESINIKELFNKFQNKPAIIVSAGPSLAKNVELLKGIKNKAVIICVGTALRVLLDKGIKPDLVITVDPAIVNYRHFENIEFDDIPLVYYSCANPQILQKHKGEKIVFKSQDIYLGKTMDTYMKNIERLNSGGSVAHNALDLAIKMGGDPIIFIGQDLAYTDNKTHSEGTVYENDSLENIEGNNKLVISKKVNMEDGSHEIKEEKKTVVVKDIYGNNVITDEVLYSYLKWLENVVEANNDRLYINATEGGAKIQGTSILTLKETIQKYCINDIGVEEIIKRIIKQDDIDTTPLLNELEKIEKQLKEIILQSSHISQQIKVLIEKFYSTKNTKILKALNKMKKIEDLLKAYKEGFNSINFILDPVLLDINNSISSKDNMTLKEQLEINKSYYEGINKCATRALFSIGELIGNNFVKIMEFTININS
jgi:hypothetical protein